MVVEKSKKGDGANPAVAKQQEAGDLTGEIVAINIDPIGKNVEDAEQENEESLHLLQANNGNIQRHFGYIVLSLHNVSYKIQPSASSRCSKGVVKDILVDLNGIFKPGINAILGPTGSGKTTVLNILSGRKSGVGVTGKVLVNGQKLPSKFKNIAGYVIQDDMVMSTLTVRESVTFSANLRLDGIMTNEERMEKVNDIIAELGLANCADTRIGSYLSRGISGGERKRTSIAMELITSSKILFLDEPTTGLDASTAHSVISLLKALANKGMTIVLTIHQPRYSIFKMFDSLLVLSKGESIYHGPSDECLTFFATTGYVCEQHDNPSDFVLDVLSGNVPSPTVSDQTNPPETKVEITKIPLTAEASEAADIAHQLVIQTYKQSQWSEKVRLELKNLENGTTEEKDGDVEFKKKLKAQRPSSFCKQFLTVSMRTWRNTIRDRHALSTMIASSLLLSLIVGSIYFQIDKSTHNGFTKIQNRIGAFFFVVMNYVFGNMSAVDIFIKERAIYIHEVVSGYYCVSAYFLAKLLFDVIPQRFIPISLFAVITFFMIGLHASVGQFFFYFLNIVMTSIAGTSVALFFSASTKQHTIGTVFTALVWVIMMVYSGLMVNVETIPHFLQWLSYLSIFRYSMNGFLVNEMKDMVFCNDVPSSNNSTITTAAAAPFCFTGNEYLESQGIPYLEPIHLWINEIALCIITLAFLLLTFIQLRRSIKVSF